MNKDYADLYFIQYMYLDALWIKSRRPDVDLPNADKIIDLMQGPVGQEFFKLKELECCVREFSELKSIPLKMAELMMARINNSKE